MIVFEKQYDYESLYDLSMDTAAEIYWHIRGVEIPSDKHNFQKGKFTVTIKMED